MRPEGAGIMQIFSIQKQVLIWYKYGDIPKIEGEISELKTNMKTVVSVIL